MMTSGRTVALIVPHFLIVPFLVRQSGVMAVVPHRVARAAPHADFQKGCMVGTSQPIPLPRAAPVSTSVGKCLPATTRKAATPTAPA